MEIDADKLLAELERRSLYYRMNQNEHNINTAVMVALLEVKQSIEAAKKADG